MSVFPSKILLGTDGSEDSELAARAAIDLCRETGSELHVVHVGETTSLYPSPPAGGPPPPSSMPTREELRQNAQRLLDDQIERIKELGGEVEEIYLRMGRPTEEILSLSEDIIAGLIVVGNQGIGGRFSRMRRIVTGSVSEGVTRYARCSVMVVRRDLYDRPPS